MRRLKPNVTAGVYAAGEVHSNFKSTLQVSLQQVRCPQPAGKDLITADRQDN